MKRLFFQFLYELKSAWRGITRNWALSLSALGAVTVSLFLIACFSLIGYHTEQFASGGKRAAAPCSARPGAGSGSSGADRE